MPIISVITVCYNAASLIERTIASVEEQTHADIEYIVVDGGSKDGTQDIVRRHAARIARFTSEKDAGIFDAMNKGVAMATGDFVFFLNADDVFCDKDVVADIAAAAVAEPDRDLFYGNVMYASASRVRRRSFHWVTGRNIFFGDLNHQAVFARRQLFDKLGAFDLSYPINADYDWLLRVFHSGARARYIDRDISVFAEGGFHMQHAEKREAERLTIKHKYNPSWRRWLGYWMLRVDLKVRKLKGQSI
jgi:glycosyltransferase involved in cell wall biosynthesis